MSELANHPVVKRAAGQFVAQPDRVEAARRQVQEWGECAASLVGMRSGDPAATATLYRARELLADVTRDFGFFPGWTRAQRMFLYEAAARLLGPDQRVCGPPNWTEDF